MMIRFRRPGRRRPSSDSDDDSSLSLNAVDWRRLFAYLKPYRTRMVLAILALLFSSGFGLAFPLVIVQLLDSVNALGTSSHSV